MIQEEGLSRLAGVVRRRRGAVALGALAAAAAGLAWVSRLPPAYEARAVVRIDDPRPAREYVAPTVSEPPVERLKSRRLGFLARPLVIEAAARAGLDESTALVAARLDARQEGEDTFVLTYTDRDRGRARAFLAALTDAYGTRRAAEMAGQAVATAAFFARQVDELRPRVAEADAAVERWRAAHYGALPDQLDANMQLLDSTTLAAHAVQASLDVAQGRRRGIVADAAAPLRRQEEDAARAVSAARARYTPGSAEVASLVAELARVRAEREGDEHELARRLRRDPELSAADREIAGLRGHLEALAGREAELRGRIEGAARNAGAMARMTLDRDILRDRLRALVGKQEEARLAAGLEQSVSGAARVRVVEPAWASAAPVAPPRLFLGALAVLAGLAFGVGLGFVLDAADRRVRSIDDVRLMTGDVPILGIVPPLGRTGKEVRSS